MQFDAYENKNPSTKKRFPYLLDVQADLLDSLETRVVVPLAFRESSQRTTLQRLMPVLQIHEQDYVAYIPQVAGVARSRLGECVANLAEARPAIIGALDLLLTGV